jgi:hypothetical protein
MKDCTPPPPPNPDVEFGAIGVKCSDQSISVQGHVSMTSGMIGRIDVTDQFGNNYYSFTGNGGSARTWGFTIPADTYAAGTDVIFTCVAAATDANAAGGTTTKTQTMRVVYCDPDAPDPIAVTDPNLTLYLYDGVQEDDDRLNVYLNGVKIVNSISLRNNPNGDYVDITLRPGVNEIVFEGVRDGGGGCTADIKIWKRDRITNPLYPSTNRFDASMSGSTTNNMFNAPLPRKTWYITY